MVDDHPDLELLQESAGNFRWAQQFLEHLTKCARCQRRFRSLLDSSANVVLFPGGNSLPIDGGLPFETSSGLPLDALNECSLEGLGSFILSQKEFQARPSVERLVEQAREESFKCPARAEIMAQSALHLIDRFEGEAPDPRRVEDLRSRAWSCLANARRLQSDFCGAEEAFAAASSHLRGGTRRDQERAIHLELKASLKADQRQFKEALSLLKRAAEIFFRANEPHMQARCLVKVSVVYEAAGCPEQAIPIIKRAIPLIDGVREPRLLLCAVHNLTYFLAGAGRYLEARAAFLEAEALYGEFPEPWAQNRFHWVQARIARGLGNLESSESFFLAARSGFLDDDARFDYALVSLELARLYSQQGRRAEIKQVAQEILPFFISKEIHREALAALTLFKEAAEAENVTFELLDRLVKYLPRAERDPDLSFEAFAKEA